MGPPRTIVGPGANEKASDDVVITLYAKKTRKLWLPKKEFS